MSCGSSLGEAAHGGTRKVISILFADMVDSTGLGESLDPETTRSVMNLYFDALRATIEQHGGTVEKFVGDAVMAVFGIPTVHEDDALRAVRAAVAMQRTVGGLSDELEGRIGRRIQLRIGINTGEVVAGSNLDEATGIIGDPVNVAARLERLAEPGGIVVGAATHRLINRTASTEPLRSVDLAGKSDRVEAYKLHGVIDDEAPRHLDAPLIGRERELDALLRSFDRVVEDRSCALFTLLGAAGVGKSRLAREFIRAIAGRARVLTGRCLSYGEGITFWPISEAIAAAGEISERDSQEDALAKIAGLLGDQEDAKTITTIVGEMMGLGQRSAGQEEIFWAVRKLLESVASDKPLVVVFDDIHWAEETFLDLVDHVVDWTRDAPLLVVCLARQELLESRPAWGGGKLNSTTMLLDALRADEARNLLESRLEGDVGDIDDQLASVLEAAGGNPLFLEETIAMLVEDGAIEKSDGHWVGVKEVDRPAIPPTIQALLAARLDQLPGHERHTTEAASMIGKVFSRESIEPLMESDEEIETILESLTRKGLIRRDPSGDFTGEQMYRFRHILIRDTAYQGIPKERRATLHQRYADWVVETMGDRVTEYEEIVGYHYEQADYLISDLGSSNRAARRNAAIHLGRAGHRALARGDLAAAESLLTRALRLADDDQDALEIAVDLGTTLIDAGRFVEASDVLKQAEQRAEIAGDVAGMHVARLHYYDARLHAENLSTGAIAPLIEESLEELKTAGHHAGVAYAYRSLSYLHDTVGRSRESIAALHKAIEHAEIAGDDYATRKYKRVLMGSISWSPIDLSSLIRETEAFLIDAQAAGDLRSEARAMGILGKCHSLQGKPEIGKKFILREQAIYDKLGLDVARAWSVFEAVAVERAVGDLDAAERELRAAADVLRQRGEHLVLSTVAALLADICLEKGNEDEARSLVEEALRLSAPDDLLTQTKCFSVHAKIAVSEGRKPEAMELARKAVDLMAPSEYLDWHADALADLADVAEACGDHDAAREALQAALALYDRKEMTVNAQAILKKLQMKQ